MKYYYILHDGAFKNKVILGKDNSRICNDENKIIVTKINNYFHVLICSDGVYENEKRILTYPDLVNLLKVVPCNIYFINVNSDVANYINSDIKDDYKANIVDYFKEPPEPIFTVKDGNLLKMNVGVNRDAVKSSLEKAYHDDISHDGKASFWTINELMENKELFELYNYPIYRKDIYRNDSSKFILPNYSYSNPSIFYMLSGIYKKNGDLINITKKDLSNLYLASIMREGSVSNVIDNLDIDILNKYSLKELSKSIESIDSYKNQEDDTQIKLTSLKKCILEAKENSKYVNGLGLLKDKKEKNVNIIKELIKKEG